MQFYKENEGTIRHALWESDKHNGYMYAFTDNYIKVRTKYDESLINEVTPVLLTKLNVGNDDVYDCEIK